MSYERDLYEWQLDTEALEEAEKRLWRVKMKKELRAALADKVLRVHFVKKDKSERAMVCTLDMSRIPAEHHPKNPKVEKDNILSVWDLEKSGWRSITVDNITGLEKV